MPSYMKKYVYVLLYIHADTPEYSEVLAVFHDKHKAVNSLLEVANYRDNNGLTQYMKPTDEYPSYAYLYDKVYREMELTDIDIYKIEERVVL